MTIYQYAVVAGTTINFNPATDQLSFPSGASASGLRFVSFGDDIAVADAVNDYVNLVGAQYSALVTDSFIFADGSKFLIGTSGSNSLTGSAQGDYFDAGSGGTDILPGLDGDDLFLLNAGLDGSDQISGGNGFDILRLSGSYASQIVLGANTITGVELIDLGSGALVRIHLHDGLYSGSTFVQIVTNQTSSTDSLELDGSNVTAGQVYAAGGAGADVLIGGSVDDFFEGNAGNDVINGGVGGDFMSGGTGDDTYLVDNALDATTENASEGSDLVQSSVTHTLQDNVEFLTLTGSGAINGTGNVLANILTGNSGNNTLSGLGGNDTINGGGGNDTMIGGAGDDTYTVDSASDVVTELVGEGTDLVQSSVTYTLSAEVENLTLTGTGAINGTGNALNNVLTGNSGANTLNGGDGNDTLDGGSNADTMVGGLGADTYVVTGSGDVVTENFGEGSDTVQSSITYALGANVENLTLTGTAAINATGNTANNTLTGNSGNNLIDGGAGNDAMAGGAGNDTYTVDSVTDTVTELGSSGTDLVQSSVSFTIGSNVENLTLTGSAAIDGTGNGLDNVITGNSGNNTLIGAGGNDTLDGGAGNDTMVGGAGNETYTVDSASDVVTELSGEGTDLVQSSIGYTLGANVENLTLTGTAAINATGNTLNNTLTGNSGNNVLDGGTGNDTMVGGAGGDTYVVDSALDSVTENFGSGNDTVQSSVTYTLGINLENLTLTGTAAINATGNTANNLVTGNSGNNLIDGGTGNDTMSGGDGDDTFVVDSSLDSVDGGLGTDLVQAAATFTLGSTVENLTLTGSAAINGTGNALNNVLTGNSGNNTLNGAGGTDTIDGGAGDDTLVGGAGNDSYTVDSAADVVTELAAEGTDLVQSSVTYALAANVENLTLTGSAAINATGNTLNNVLTGNSGNNTLNGGAGNDTMAGGAGSDTYVVDSILDTVTENVGEGTDFVQSSVSFTLGSNVEDLVLNGAGAINGTGNALNNVLIGGSGNNVLDGAGGADTMSGSLGDDTYVVDSAGDVVTEAVGEGTDLVQSSITHTLSSNIETLTLTGVSNIDGTGNAQDNVLNGNSGNNTLSGGGGSDTLDGGGGADNLIGGAGDDTYTVDSASDTVTEAAGEGTDLVQSSITFTLGAEIENLTLTGGAAINGTGNALNNVLTGNSGVNTLSGGAGNDTYVVDNAADMVTELVGEGADLVQSSVSYMLGAEVENLTLTGAAAINGTGNALDNILNGNSSSNTLNGSGGADTMAGGAGNDTYVVDNASDVVTEAAGEGTDLVQATATFTLGADIENLTLTGNAVISGTGNGLANVITGNSNNNTLTGGAGNDTLFGSGGTDILVGGADNDSYTVNSAGDVVTEAANEGTDSVSSDIAWTLANNIENLTLTGIRNVSITGNGLANVLTGNSGNNTPNGGSGADTMAGGGGGDTYVVDDVGDVITEAANAGKDSVQSSISHTLADNVDNLTLTGAAAIDGTGNILGNNMNGNSAANVLNGGDGADVLNGGAGVDTLIGGLGNDTYNVDNTSTDTIVENVGEGNDVVRANVSYVLGANLENLVLVSSSNFNATGNAANNVITGNSGNNNLNGAAGRDTLNGGLGADRFVFSSESDTAADAQRDVISDFLSADGDKVTLSAIDAVSAMGGDQAFTFIGTAAFSGTDASGQLRFQDGIVYGSTDADSAAEFSIGLTGVVSMVAGDFIL